MSVGLKPTCLHEGCDRKPTHYLRMEVPPVGYGYDKAIKMMVGAVMCKDHAKAATVEEWLSDTVKEVVEYTIKNVIRSTCPADFSRARMGTGRIEDPEFQDFIRSKVQHEGGGNA